MKSCMDCLEIPSAPVLSAPSIMMLHIFSKMCGPTLYPALYLSYLGVLKMNLGAQRKGK